MDASQNTYLHFEVNDMRLSFELKNNYIDPKLGMIVEVEQPRKSKIIWGIILSLAILVLILFSSKLLHLSGLITFSNEASLLSSRILFWVFILI